MKSESNNSISKPSIQDLTSKKKLTYKLEFELKTLPNKIITKEKEIAFFTKKLSNPDFYKSDSESFIAMTEELESAKEDLERFEERWLELESLKE